MRSLAVLAAFLSLSACGLGTTPAATTPSPSPSEATSGSGIPQDLTFLGKLPARWTSADAACGQADGKGSDSFSVKLTAADAQGQMDTLTIVVGAGYKGAGEYSVDTIADLVTAGPASVRIATSSPELRTHFTVTVDKVAGTIDSTMAGESNPLDAIERVAGTWRCS